MQFSIGSGNANACAHTAPYRNTHGISASHCDFYRDFLAFSCYCARRAGKLSFGSSHIVYRYR